MRHLLLYVAVVWNEDNRCMPIFYMLYSKDNGQGHQGIAIEISLEYVFKNIGNVRPNEIIIYKNMTFLNVIITIMRNNHFNWKDKRIGGEQIVC